MAYASVDGIRLWYELKGTGEPLLQFHGLGLGHVNFAAVTPLLRRHFTVLDWDMRGFGDSDKPAPPYSLDMWAEDAVRLLDHLGLERVHVHGSSMGGQVAIAFAARYPERVRRLVLGCCMARYDTMAIFNKRVWKAMARATGMSPDLALMIATQAFSRDYMDRPEAPAQLRQMAEAFAKNDLNLWIHYCDLVEEVDLEPLLPTIKAPTLVMSGDSDIMTPVDAGPRGVGSRKIAESIPGASFLLIKNCGHLSLVERADESSDIITKFLMQA